MKRFKMSYSNGMLSESTSGGGEKMEKMDCRELVSS